MKTLRDPDVNDDELADLTERFGVGWAAAQGRYEIRTMARMEAIDMIHTAKRIIDNEGCPRDDAVSWAWRKYNARWHDFGELDRHLLGAAIDGWVVAEKQSRRDFTAICRLLRAAGLVARNATSGSVRSAWVRWRRTPPGSHWEQFLPALRSMPSELASTAPERRRRSKEPSTVKVNVDEVFERLKKTSPNTTREGLLKVLRGREAK